MADSADDVFKRFRAAVQQEVPSIYEFRGPIVVHREAGSTDIDSRGREDHHRALRQYHDEIERLGASVAAAVDKAGLDSRVIYELIEEIKAHSSSRQIGELKCAAYAVMRQAENSPGRGSPPKEKPSKKPTVNMRMTETIQKNAEAMGWTSGDWSRHLKCSRSTVCGTPTWENLKNHRLALKAEKAKDRTERSRRTRRRAE